MSLDFESSAIWRKRARQKLLALWDEMSLLKILYGLVALVISLVLLILFYGLYSPLFPDSFGLPKMEVIIGTKIDSNFALASLGTITGLIALFGGWLAIWRSETNERQTVTAEQGLITERINKATEGLGKSDRNGKAVIEVRLGALYALERIAQDSLRDHIQIMEIICAYVRYNSPKKDKKQIENKKTDEEQVKDKEDTDNTKGENLSLAYLTGKKARKPFRPVSFFATKSVPKIDPLREDIQTALNIIGRRDKWPNAGKYLETENEKGYKIDLSHCSLRGMVLKNAEMSDAQFENTDMTGANLDIVNMSGANFTEANMSNTKHFLTNMSDAKTRSAFAWDGFFSGCIGFFQDQLDEMFLGKRVILSNTVDHPQKDFDDYYKDYETFDEFMKARDAWEHIQGLKRLSKALVEQHLNSKKNKKD